MMYVPVPVPTHTSVHLVGIYILEYYYDARTHEH